MAAKDVVLVDMGEVGILFPDLFNVDLKQDHNLIGWPPGIPHSHLSFIFCIGSINIKKWH